VSQGVSTVSVPARSPVGGADGVGRNRYSVPPVLTGGVNSHSLKSEEKNAHSSIGIDWISGTMPFVRLDDVIKYVSRLLESSPELRDYGMYRYDHMLVWPLYGVQLMFDSSEDRSLTVHNGRILLVIPGGACTHFSAEVMHHLVYDLIHNFWMKATRLDLCFDDYDRQVEIPLIEKACVDRDIAGFRTFEVRRPQRTSGVLLGESINFGVRGQNGGGKYLRVYDKNLESEGEQNCIRWEVEFSKEKAQAVFFALSQTDSLDAFASLLGAFIGGSIDFVHRKDRNLDRAMRLEWWERIRSYLGSARLRGASKLVVVERSMDWIEKSVAPSMRMIVKACGYDDFASWVFALCSAGSLNKYQADAVSEYVGRNGNPYERAGAF